MLTYKQIGTASSHKQNTWTKTMAHTYLFDHNASTIIFANRLEHSAKGASTELLLQLEIAETAHGKVVRIV